MAQTPQPSSLEDAVGVAQTETKRLAAQARRTGRALAQLRAKCHELGIEFVTEPVKEQSHGR